MLKIGDLVIDPPVVLGPMAGVTDMPFRRICREMGCGMVCTEMVSAKALVYRNKRTACLLETCEEERPVSLQLFGSEPETMAEAARMIDGLPFDVLDINMGCPVPKVVNNGEGSALMKDPGLVKEIVSAVAGASSKPVSVKIRRGFDEEHLNAVEVALAAEEGGAMLIAVHGRTRQQYYSGNADWDCIRDVKSAVTVPVIGNGDIRGVEDIERMIEHTGCDAVMISRAARGNPWIFRDAAAYFEGGNAEGRPDIYGLGLMIKRHFKEHCELKGEYIAVREMRKHIAWYTAGYPDSARLRQAVNTITSAKELTQLIDRWVYAAGAD